MSKSDHSYGKRVNIYLRKSLVSENLQFLIKIVKVKLKGHQEIPMEIDGKFSILTAGDKFSTLTECDGDETGPGASVC